MRIAALLFALLSTFGAQAEPKGPRVWVRASPLAVELERALREELPPERFARAEEFADALIGIDEGDSEIVLSMTSSSGSSILERRIATDHGRAPALRAALIVAVEALKVEAEPPPPPLPPPPLEARIETGPPAADVHLRLGAGFEVSSFRLPLQGELGVRAFGDVAIERLSFGAGVSLIGTAFWDVAARDSAGKDAVIGSSRSISPWLRVQYAIFERPAFAIAVAIEGGLSFDRLEARAAAFKGPAESEVRNHTTFLGRAAVSLFLPIFSERFFPVLSAGVALHAPKLSIGLPDMFPSDSKPLESGVAAPWAGVGLVGTVF